MNCKVERCNSVSERAKTEGTYSLLQNGPTLLIDIFHIARLTDSTFYCRMDQNFDHPEFFTGGRKEAGFEVMVTYNLSSILKIMLYKSCLQLYKYYMFHNSPNLEHNSSHPSYTETYIHTHIHSINPVSASDLQLDIEHVNKLDNTEHV